MFDWNDLRHFLAVARAGSTLGAAEGLKVNQTTVARRIAALEQALGAKLFDKASAGYRLTELGSELLPVAERVEVEAETVLRLTEQRARRLTGTVRVTTNETIADIFLMPSVTEFCDLYPHIRLDIVVDARHLDLNRGEADVALRVGGSPGSGAIVARKLRHLPWGVYCSRATPREAAVRPPPKSFASTGYWEPRDRLPRSRRRAGSRRWPGASG